MLNPKGERIRDDLRGLLKGDVFADTVRLQAYATDASLYEIRPLCVVCPKTVNDVISVVSYARKNGLTIHPRGAGSNCTGAALGEGIVLDMSRYMRRILHYFPDSNVIHIQAGMQCSRINEFLTQNGKHFLPGIGTSWPDTIGGLVSLDGYGNSWLSYGRPSDWLQELEIVTANGNLLTFTNQEILDLDTETETETNCGKGSEPNAEKSLEKRSGMISEKFFDSETSFSPEEEKEFILNSVRQTLCEFRPQSGQVHTPKVIDKIGYSTNILNGGKLNMARLIAGAEGTLGIITSMKIKVPEIAPFRKTILLLADSVEKAMQAASNLLQFHPDSCDLIDRRYLHRAKERDVRYDAMFAPQTEAVLILQLSDSTQFNLINRIRSLSEQIVRQKKLAFEMIVSFDETEADLLREAGGRYAPFILSGSGKPVRNSVIEDAAVPPAKLHEFFLKIQELLRNYQMSAAFCSHAIQGQVRIQPLAELPNDGEHLMKFLRDFYQLVHSMNGTIGSEYGLGIGWQFWLPFFPSEKLELTYKIKQIFDPNGLFQPGKKGCRPEEEKDGKNAEIPQTAPEMLWRRSIRPAKPFDLLTAQEDTEDAQTTEGPEHSHEQASPVEAALTAPDLTESVKTESSCPKLPVTETAHSQTFQAEASSFEASPSKVSPLKASPSKASLAETEKSQISAPADARSKESSFAETNLRNAADSPEKALLQTGKGLSDVPSPAASDMIPTAPQTKSAPNVNVQSMTDSQLIDSRLQVMEKVRKIIGNAFDDFTDESLRKQEILPEDSADSSLPPINILGSDWNSDQIRRISHACSGCGKCRGKDNLRRTCPVFRYDCSEFSAPRAKVNLLEGIVSESLNLSEMGDQAFRNIIHRCIQCHSCRVECPAEMDIPFLVRQAEEVWAKTRGLDFYETSLVHIDLWFKRFHFYPYLMNLLRNTGWFRWFLEKTFGIARERNLPKFETRSFLEKIQRNPQILETPNFQTPITEDPLLAESSAGIQGQAVYFLDTYANYFDARIAESVIQIFRHNRVPITVPQHQTGSGITAVMLGRKEIVKTQIFRNAALLADYVRQGYDVIVSEPTTALAFRWEFPQTYPENEDLALVAKHCFDVGEYLYKLHISQLLKMPDREMDMKIGYHAPCRLRALKIGTPFVHVLRLIPGAEILTAPNGCCGMGGFHGMLAANYSASLKIGRSLQSWFRNPTIQVGATECSACKIQMMQNSTKPVLHPIQILAKAYGL